MLLISFYRYTFYNYKYQNRPWPNSNLIINFDFQDMLSSLTTVLPCVDSRHHRSKCIGSWALIYRQASPVEFLVDSVLLVRISRTIDSSLTGVLSGNGTKSSKW